MNHLVKLFLFFAIVLLGFFSCKEVTEKTIEIGFSQAMSTDDWRKQMNNSMKIQASLMANVSLTISDANNDIQKQIEDIERFVRDKVDVIIVSPIESKPLTEVVEKSIKKGIPVLVIDRKIEGENYTSYIGADNIEVGRNAAKYIISHSKGSGKIIEIMGLKGSSPAYERSVGFKQIIDNNKNVTLINKIAGNWEKESVKAPLREILLKDSNIEYVFAHNDRMALSAWETAKIMGLESKIKFIGVDGLNTLNGGIKLVKNGVLEGTILYPTGGDEALKLALKIYSKKPFLKNNILNTIMIDMLNVEILENQLDRIDEQQAIVEGQQAVIKVQDQAYTSQNNLVRLLVLFLIIILSLAIYSLYSIIFISKKKKELERINETVIIQKKELEKMSDVIKESNEIKLNFFTQLSHELKTSVTLIMSYVESLIENKKIKDINLIEEIKLIYKNSDRLFRIINQLLDFRKIEDQKFKLRTSKTNIFDFTKNLMANFRREATRRNIEFQLICDNENIELFIDRGLMDKVYFNLLSNAFKFTPDNGKINIIIKGNSNHFVKIYFKDSGIGIPENELCSVFNPFFCASNNNKNSSGIGLNLSKEFIHLHKGKLELRSKQGAEFIITLLKGSNHLEPVEIVENLDNQPNIPNSILNTLEIALDSVAQQQISELEKLTLLIIEDNTDLVSFLNNKLISEYNIHISYGDDAEEKALEIIPDIIIYDINLTDKDGFEITKKLKKDLRTSHIPIIILTAESDKESILKGLQSGVDQYLTKPFSMSVLKESISNLLFNREKLRYYYTNNIYRVEPESKFGNTEQNFIMQINDLIKNNIENHKIITVEDLAEQLNISRIQLYRKVKAIIGINISDHINNIKLEKAAELLKSSEMNISEIAYVLGFSSPNYFSTAFKNKFGISPKQFKTNIPYSF